jgi:penicillin-binding protein-related factor A (putative recombinase)
MKSTGKTGERIAEMWFKSNGWKMFRHQPETKTVYLKGRGLTTIQCRSDGVSDYTGYENVQLFNGIFPIYRACEVKEAHGNSMPCSRLKEEQRDWLNAIDQRSAFVGVVWMEDVTFELFRFKYTGSYKRGEGLLKTKYQ